MDDISKLRLAHRAIGENAFKCVFYGFDRISENIIYNDVDIMLRECSLYDGDMITNMIHDYFKEKNINDVIFVGLGMLSFYKIKMPGSGE